MENYIIANRTDVGKNRQVNEDSMITFDSPNGRVVAVCDGMGGQAAGDVASRLACNIIRDILENNTFQDPLEAITRSIMAANQGILHRASQNPEQEGMGATCVMLIIKDGLVSYGWVGDSRIYYINNHTIRQISKDQSFVQSLVDSGEITAEEAEHHPQKNEITNALGVQGMTPPLLCQHPIKPEPGSIFLLCSDGLSGMVDNSHIEHIVSRPDGSLQDKANQLVALANQNGGLDNITVQLVQFVGEEQENSDFNDEETDDSSDKKKRLIMIVTGVLIVLAIGTGAFFMFSNNENKEEKQKIEGGTDLVNENRGGDNGPGGIGSGNQPPETVDGVIGGDEKPTYSKGKDNKGKDHDSTSGIAKGNDTISTIPDKGKDVHKSTSKTKLESFLKKESTKHPEDLIEGGVPELSDKDKEDKK